MNCNSRSRTVWWRCQTLNKQQVLLLNNTYLYKSAEDFPINLENPLLFSIVHKLRSHRSVALGDDGFLKTLALGVELRSEVLVVLLIFCPGLCIAFHYFDDFLATTTGRTTGHRGAFLFKSAFLFWRRTPRLYFAVIVRIPEECGQQGHQEEECEHQREQ